MKAKDIKSKFNCENIDMEELSIKELKHLKNQAKSLTDIRMKRKCKYKIWDIVCVALLAVISNCNEWEEIEMFAIKNKETTESDFFILVRVTGLEPASLATYGPEPYVFASFTIPAY